MTPHVSILTTVFDPEPEHLSACLASVARQDYGDFEHVIVDDASTSELVAEVLARAAAADPRIRLTRRADNGGIVAASRDALGAAVGEYVALLDHDDVLDPGALSAMVTALDDSGADVGYSDHDFIRTDGRFVTPCYKPDFSPERLRAQNYITHFLVARRSAVTDAGGFRDGFDGAQDHDLTLRLAERTDRFVHVPRVLYHWRQSPASVSSGPSKPWAFEAGRRAVAEHCERQSIPADVIETAHEGCYRVVRRLEATPLVSVVIPTRGTSGRVWGATRAFVVDAVRSIIERSTYDNVEFVVVYDDVTPGPVRRALSEIGGERLALVPFSEPFNFSAKVNLGVTHASGDLVLLLNDDTELIEPTSIEVLVAHLLTSDVAMAGAKLLFADGTLQHGGHVYARDIGHACLGWSGESPGPWPLRPLAVERECSGVTAGCALVRRSAFVEVGGFSSDLPLNYNDVDFCLKLRAAGHRIIWTPWATWYHFESRTRTSVLLDEEYSFVNQRWHYEINNDPYYNVNLLPGRSDWLERPLRSGAPAVETRPALPHRLVARTRRPVT
jgi:GT2 family glycosyltransferase